VPTQPAAAPETPAPTRSASTQASRDSSPRVESRAVERPAADAAPAQILPEADSSAPVVSAPESGAPAMPVSASDAAAPAAPAERAEGTPLWAWLLAVLAALGAGIWYWRRRPVAAREALAEPVEKIEPASAPVPAPSSPPRDAPVPSPAPAPSAPVRSPVPAPRAASPLVTRPVDEQRASVAMTLEIRDIHVTADQVAVGFALNLVNRGAVAATGLMVRIALGQGSAMPEAVLARFFDGAGGSVLRDDMMLLPGAGEQLSTEVMLPRAMIEPLMIGGRPMLVPVMAFDVTYHWDGPGEAFGQYAGSFVLGREPGEGGGKLAPLPLDRAELRVANPGQRATAMRREQ
jgi:hypothetical protein